MNTIKVNVNFKNRTIYKQCVDLTSGDYNSTKLIFEFDRQDGRKIFEMKDPNENLVLLTDIVNNEVDLVGKDENGNNASLFNQAGNYTFEISLYDGDSKLTSASDYIKVKQEQVIIDGEVVTPYLPVFDELVNDVEKIKNTIKTDGDGAKYLSDDGTYKEVQAQKEGEYLTEEDVVADKQSFSAFKKWAVIGDSLSVGYNWNKDTNSSSDRNVDYSWVQILARHYGNTAINIGFSGADTRDFFTNKNYGYVDLIKPENKSQAYVIGLGVNDAISESFPLGSLDDIDAENHRNNAVSFYGQYAKIIQCVKEVNPDAKIFCMTIPESWSSMTPKNGAIRDILNNSAINENCYLVDLHKIYRTEQFQKQYIKGYRLEAHYTAGGYANLGILNGAAISKVMNENAEDMWDIAFIPYAETQQQNLVAGDNITIEGNVISADLTNYSTTTEVQEMIIASVNDVIGGSY